VTSTSVRNRGIRRCRRTGRALLPGALLLVACSAEPPPELLLLITVDTLRADRVGAFGSRHDLTPNIDALAAESAVFTAAYAAAPFTLPSLSGLMTGRHPEELGIHRNESMLPQEIPTLASELSARGWRTHAVVSNYILRRESGIGAGFDVFDDELPQAEAVRKWPERIAGDTTDAALLSLDECTASAPRCFLWVHYQDPHGPYTPPAELLGPELASQSREPDAGRLLPLSPDHTGIGGIPTYQLLDDRRDVGFYRAGYHAEVRYVDAEVGRLLRGLGERGGSERALVALAADHGEGMGENDYWFAHGEYLDDGQIRVPLLFRVPGREPARRNDVASLLDVLPTLLAAVAEEPMSAPGPGRDLLAPGAEAAASTPYFATLGGSRGTRFGLVADAYKLVISERDGVWDGELTRLGGNGTDLAAAAPQIAGPMRKRLRHIRSLAVRARESRREISEEERENLRALGYVDESGGP
jgi:arylsulfatase A-like enzyme